MKSIEKLIDSAGQLADQGLSQGEIADELNVARETSSWLVARSGQQPSEEPSADSPVDVHVDWSAIGRDGRRLSHLGAIMADVLHEDEDIDLTIGIGKSGAPLATIISQELDTDFSVYMPSKHQHDGNGTGFGSFSRNFATIHDRDCYVVDDNIDTGQTMTETIGQIRESGGTPRAGVVLTDKLGQDEIEDVPIRSRIEMIQLGEE
jgi:orotate phosphoribosyltransferase